MGEDEALTRVVDVVHVITALPIVWGDGGPVPAFFRAIAANYVDFFYGRGLVFFV